MLPARDTHLPRSSGHPFSIGGERSGSRVLIVEDSPGDAYLVRYALAETELDFDSEQVATLGEAEERLAAGEFSVILLDLGLPDARGAETVERIRKLAPGTPVVVLTALTGDAVLEAALEADADDFIPKTEITPTSLARSIRHARQRRRMALRLQLQTRELEASEERLQSVLGTISDGVAVVDEEGRVLFANDSFQRIAGGVGGTEAVIPGLADERTALIEFRPDDDSEAVAREVEVTSAPIVWEGRPARVSSLRDVTDRRQMEARLRTAQRMEAVGQLAGGMAHEINNVLAVVLANAGLLASDPRGIDPAELVAEIDRSARRGKTLLERLLAVGRRQRLQVDVLDLGSLVRDVAVVLEGVLPEHVTLELTAPDTLLRVRADGNAIEQIILNLVNNARDAMNEGGTVRIEVGTRDVSDAADALRLGVDRGVYARLTVRDTGSGMTEETMEKAFEPFFTTKDREDGTGLGLPTVYGLVKQQGGFVHLESTVGSGTVVDVYFPAAAGMEARSTSVRQPHVLQRGSETLLLVEDEGTLRQAAARVLRRFGYTVIEAEDGIAALEQLRTTAGSVDLVVSDVVMPRLGGRGLCEAMRNLDDPPPIIFVSGYSAEDLVDGELLDPSFELLSKPWTVPELLDTIRRALPQDRKKAPQVV